MAKKDKSPKDKPASDKPPKDKPPKDKSKVWSIFSLVAALGAATVAKQVLDKSWKATTGRQPPTNPADPDVRFAEAFAWAAASGTFVAVAKMLATRRAANYYAKSTGHLPPGLQADGK